MTLGLNWPALAEILHCRSSTAKTVVHRHLVDEEVIYAMVTVDDSSTALRTPQDASNELCQIKNRYYTVIKKLTGDKVKYDVRADMARRQLMRDRLVLDSHTVQSENKLRENLYIFQQLAKQLEAANANTASSAIACLHPQVTFPPVSEAPKEPSLVGSDPQSGLPILSEEVQAALTILKNAQPAQSTADYIIDHVNSKAVFCSQLVKHAEDAILSSFYPSANKSATHHNHGKDYQDAITKILKKAKDSPEVADGVRTQDGEVITPTQYFTTDRFTPFVHTFSCFQSYAETIEAACVLSNLQKQLKILESMHTQWLEKLIDVRKNARTATRKKRA